MKKLKDKFTRSLQRPVVLAVTGGVVTLVLALLVVTSLIIVGFLGGTGFSLVSENAPLIAPLIGALIALGGVLTTQMVNTGLENQRAHRQQHLEQQRAQNDALQKYLEQMGQLLIREELRSSKKESNARILARAQTLVALHNAGPDHKRIVLQFLYESALIYRNPEPVVELAGANLKEAKLGWIWQNGANLKGVLLQWADLRNAFLEGTDLREAFLEGTDLRGAKIWGADLRGAFLWGADFRGAFLEGTNLGDAQLQGAKVTDEQLATCESLEGATMPDGSVHD
jgi:Pentapeptide repeats (8 copies)